MRNKEECCFSFVFVPHLFGSILLLSVSFFCRLACRLVVHPSFCVSMILVSRVVVRPIDRFIPLSSFPLSMSSHLLSLSSQNRLQFFPGDVQAQACCCR